MTQQVRAQTITMEPAQPCAPFAWPDAPAVWMTIDEIRREALKPPSLGSLEQGLDLRCRVSRCGACYVSSCVPGFGAGMAPRRSTKNTWPWMNKLCESACQLDASRLAKLANAIDTMCKDWMVWENRTKAQGWQRLGIFDLLGLRGCTSFLLGVGDSRAPAASAAAAAVDRQWQRQRQRQQQEGLWSSPPK